MTGRWHASCGRLMIILFVFIAVINIIFCFFAPLAYAQTLSGQYAGKVLWVGTTTTSGLTSIQGFIDKNNVSTGASQYNYFVTDNSRLRAAAISNRAVYYLNTFPSYTVLNAVEIDTNLNYGFTNMDVTPYIPNNGTHYGLTVINDTVIACTDTIATCWQIHPSGGGGQEAPAQLNQRSYNVDVLYTPFASGDIQSYYVGVTASGSLWYQIQGSSPRSGNLDALANTVISAVSYEPVKGYHFIYNATGHSIFQYDIDTDKIGATSFVPYSNPLAPITPNRIVVANGGDANTTFVDVYQITGNFFNTTTVYLLAYTFSSPIEAITYTGPLGEFKFIPTALTRPTTSFGIDPSFLLTQNDPIINASLLETTTPLYGDFTTFNNSVYPWPYFWLRNPGEIPYPSGTSSDGLTVEALSTTSTTPTNSFSFKTILFTGSTTILELSALNNPDSALRVTGPHGISSLVEPGAVKFSLNIGGPDVASTFFFSNSSATLRWNTCVKNTQQIGSFNLSYTSSINPSDIVYTFVRSTGNNDSKIALTISTVGVVDNTTVVSIPHKLSPDPFIDIDGILNICVEWEFPYFTRSLRYDPDLAVLTGSDDSVSDGGDGNNYIVVEIVVPVVVGLCCICVVCILVILIVIALISKRQRLRDMIDADSQVNFTEMD